MKGRRGGPGLNAAALRVMAEVVRRIPEREVREVVANHFCQEMNRLSGGFDPSVWTKATGGTLTGPTRVIGE